MTLALFILLYLAFGIQWLHFSCFHSEDKGLPKGSLLFWVYIMFALLWPAVTIHAALATIKGRILDAD